MAEEEFIPYKDISELKKELEGIKGKKDVSPKELYDAVQQLAQSISGMLDVFGAAAEQMKLEEKGYESESKKHDIIVSKLDKVVEQNKTIAEAMVGIVDMLKERIAVAAKKEDSKPRQEPRLFEPKPFMKPMEWQPKPEPVQRTAPIMAPPMPAMAPMAQMPTPQMPPPMAAPMPSDFGMQMPPMEPTPPPDLDIPEDVFGLEEPKKKGLFGMFKK